MKRKKGKFDEVIMYRTRMSKILSQFSSPSHEGSRLEETSDPVIDVWEREGDILVECELPGVSEDQIALYVDKGYLVIEGHKTESADQACQRYLRLERQYGFFRRIIELPSSVHTAHVQAVLRDGLLSIRFAKVTERRKEKVEIPISR